MTPVTQVSLCTTRLECSGPNLTSLGTGYFYAFQYPSDQEKDEILIPAIITNKHVINGASQIKITVQIIKQGADVKEDASTDQEERKEFIISDLHKNIIHHPSDEIDLCVIPIGIILNSIPAGYGVKNVFIRKSWHLGEAHKSQLRPIEPILMIGYPNGLWDKENNRPIARHGYTATHALKKWNGKREFLIDAACFPGSSGSPVFLFEDGMYRTPNGYTPGTSIKLLGTLWGGPIYNAEGQLIPRAIPAAVQSKTEQIPVVDMMLNLGFVIHADAIDDFSPLVLQFSRQR